jgi:hypothetical protein
MMISWPGVFLGCVIGSGFMIFVYWVATWPKR